MVDWWSTARQTIGPIGVSISMPRRAVISASVSVDFALRMALATVTIVE